MTNDKHRIRVLLAKPGLDSHDRGVKLVAHALRDAGIETVFMGIQVTPEEIVRAALQESVDVIGLSVFSGGHMVLIPRILTMLEQEGLADVPVILGGIIPPEDATELKTLGVKEVLGPGCANAEVIEAFARWGAPQKSKTP